MEDRMHGQVYYPAHSCASTSGLLDAVAALLPPQSKDVGTGGLACPVCESPPLQPATLPCGHTVCRCCVVGGVEGGAGCPRCGTPVPSTGVATNVLAQALVERWWPEKMNAARSREAAVDLVRAGRFAAAVDKLDEAVAIDPDNYVLRIKRAQAFSWLGRHQEALQDADQAIKLKPTSSKGYYRRGCALAGLNHPEDALVAFCICAALDRNPNAVRADVARVLQQLAVQATRTSRGNRRCGSGCPSISLTNKWRSLRCPLPQASDSDRKDVSLGHDHDERRNQRTTCSILSNQMAVRETCVFTALLERVLQQTEKLIKTEVDGNPSETEGCDLKIDPQLVDASDFDCVLCGRILWRPVTTPCGHTYCCMCLDRCLDYSSSCPLCMTSLADYLSTSPKSISDWIERAIRLAIPQEWASRQAAEAAEATAAAAAGGSTATQGTATNPPPPSESTISPTVIPVFVCTTAFPGVPCPLFVYEPRYRLMIRRCIQSGTRRFGIAACIPRGSSRFADYGTLLEIRDCVRLSDGCSLLSTIGSARFRVLQRSERDGYETALVQIVRDSSPSATSLPALRELHDSVRAKSGAWLNAMSTELRAEVERSFGPMPPVEDTEDWASTPDGPAWTWYLLAVLPLGPQLQVGILSTTSLEKRLLAINKALDHLTGSARTSRVRPNDESRHVYHQHSSRSNHHNTAPIPTATSSTSL